MDLTLWCMLFLKSSPLGKIPERGQGFQPHYSLYGGNCFPGICREWHLLLLHWHSFLLWLSITMYLSPFCSLAIDCMWGISIKWNSFAFLRKIAPFKFPCLGQRIAQLLDQHWEFVGWGDNQMPTLALLCISLVGLTNYKTFRQTLDNSWLVGLKTQHWPFY